MQEYNAMKGIRPETVEVDRGKTQGMSGIWEEKTAIKEQNLRLFDVINATFDVINATNDVRN